MALLELDFSRDIRAAVDALGPALDKVTPLKAKHRARLARDVADLSRALTSERGSLGDYLRGPAFQSAYLRYFLPWNVLRLGRLLAGLPPESLELPKDARILDLGAGPQTFSLALWAARPELRDTPLKIVAVDRSRPMLRTGTELLNALTPPPAWRVANVATSLDDMLHSDEGEFQLIVAANLLNEWAAERDASLESRLARLLNQLAGKLTPTGSILLVEPGNRLGGRILTAARGKGGLKILAPCTHLAACPLPGRKDTGWCHFAFPPADPPTWLVNLSKEAGLPKERLSLSFLHLTRQAPEHLENSARVVSEAFPLAGSRLLGQYACAEPGLLLLRHENTRPLPPGALVHYTQPEPPERDPKSKALIVLPIPRKD